MSNATSCPMTVEAVNKNALTDKQVKAFCDAGCSVICGELFDKYTKQLAKRKEKSNEQQHNRNKTRKL